MIIKVQQQIDKPEAIRKIKITSKPRGQSPEVGDINIVKKAFPDIIEALAGRPKAYFVATYIGGVIKIYTEVKHKGW